jgi:hypothetical protein
MPNSEQQFCVAAADTGFRLDKPRGAEKGVGPWGLGLIANGELPGVGMTRRQIKAEAQELRHAV